LIRFRKTNQNKEFVSAGVQDRNLDGFSAAGAPEIVCFFCFEFCVSPI